MTEINATRARRRAAPHCSPRFTAQSGCAQWWVQNEKTNRLVAMCTSEQDCREIVSALNAANAPVSRGTPSPQVAASAIRRCEDCAEMPDDGTCDKCGDSILTTKDAFVPNSVLAVTSAVGTKPMSRAGTVTSKAGKVTP